MYPKHIERIINNLDYILSKNSHQCATPGHMVVELKVVRGDNETREIKQLSSNCQLNTNPRRSLNLVYPGYEIFEGRPAQQSILSCFAGTTRKALAIWNFWTLYIGVCFWAKAKATPPDIWSYWMWGGKRRVLVFILSRQRKTWSDQRLNGVGSGRMHPSNERH